jgi:ubiquinone/menaquinone biosynthesis C-methylase UbiE
MKLKLVPRCEIKSFADSDPVRFYYWPVLGRLYRRRVELCLSLCNPGRRVLEVGFGSGITFLNLSQLYDEIWGIDLTADAEGVASIYAKRGIRTFLTKGSILETPYESDYFDTVLAISILEHLSSIELCKAVNEISRILKPGGQLIYGVPVHRPLMSLGFRVLGYDISKHHLSTEKDVEEAVASVMTKEKVIPLYAGAGLLGRVYESGCFVKRSGSEKAFKAPSLSEDQPSLPFRS